jgi:hypothetical protein
VEGWGDDHLISRISHLKLNKNVESTGHFAENEYLDGGLVWPYCNKIFLG